MVFTLGTFSMQAAEEQKELDFSPNECADYAEDASRAEYEAYTPAITRAAHRQVSLEFYTSKVFETYQEWLGICEDSDGSLGDPVFL